MLILGVDTSGKNGSIVLVDCEAETSRTLDVVPLEGGTFSAQLVPQIASLLQKHGFAKHQIEAFAVVSGPGSFTGLRVGLAAIKALGEILQKPIVAVSLLEAMAITARTKGRVFAALDAGRGELYVGIYDIENRGTACVSEELVGLGEFASGLSGQQIVTPDQKLADTLAASGVAVRMIAQPKAEVIAQVAFKKLRMGQTVSPETLDATYIRRSDAEIMFDKRAR